MNASAQVQVHAVRDSSVPNVFDVDVSAVVGGQAVSGSVSFSRGGGERAVGSLGSFPGWVSQALESAVHDARFSDRSFDAQSFFDAVARAVASEVNAA